MKINDDFKSGFVAIIGRPNVGKSTLMNRLIGMKIAITSHKPQTTRNKIRTVYTDSDCQIVFVDTPGIHKAKNKLSEYMMKAVRSAVRDVDAILWIVESSEYIGKGDSEIAKSLKGIKTPVILVINKADTVSKNDMFGIINAYKDILDFSDIVPVSALKGDNCDELIKVIKKYLKNDMPFYDEDTVTDQPERAIVAEIIREKALKCLDDEIPHGIAVTVDRMQFGERICNIDATIICSKESHKGIVIGKQGSMLKKIGSAARYEIERLIDIHTNLKLFVTVRKDWRDSDILLKNYGYFEADVK